ncbi:hypothetical protein B0H17DRAFT_1052374 [Mycena rosella]|uniref:Uncharacterized protein n=1 Tax=Mycena rosella TaxID=1033263 RepID=A0AAD7GM02_MYCRO|nr:hypothetical protein B0H17DRAFT_1052374 [Mycena rosella]
MLFCGGRLGYAWGWPLAVANPLVILSFLYIGVPHISPLAAAYLIHLMYPVRRIYSVFLFIVFSSQRLSRIAVTDCT